VDTDRGIVLVVDAQHGDIGQAYQQLADPRRVDLQQGLSEIRTV
jgi:hypothetical protein